MQGGAFLGEGTYGCTFSPAVGCAVIGNNKPKVKKKLKELTKVYRTDEDVELEWGFSKILFKVDPDQKYFIYSDKRCDIPIPILKKQKDANKCTIITESKNVAKTTAKLPVLQMKFGGITLEEYVHSEKRTIREFLPKAQHILEGIRKLHSKGYIHQDLKFDNILIDKNGVPHMIDYSLLTATKGAFDINVNRYLNSKYWLHPPEYLIQQHIHQLVKDNEIDADNIIAFINHQVTENIDLTSFKLHSNDNAFLNQYILLFYPYCEYYNHLKQYTEKILNIYKKKGFTKLIKYQTSFASKVDVYSLGLTFMNLMYHMDPNDQDIRYKELIKGMIHPDPRKRMTTTQAIKHIDIILKS